MKEFTLTKLYYKLTDLLVSEFLKKRQIYNLDLSDLFIPDFKLLIFKFLSLLAYSTLIGQKTIYFGCKEIMDVLDKSPEFSKVLAIIYGDVGNYNIKHPCL